MTWRILALLLVAWELVARRYPKRSKGKCAAVLLARLRAR